MTDVAAGAQPEVGGQGAGGPTGEPQTIADVQSAQDQGAGRWQSALDAVPAEHHDVLLAALKNAEGGITRKLQEASDLRKTWEPFSSMGLDSLNPQDVAQALAFGQLLSDPTTARDIVADPAAFEDTWQKLGETLGYFEPDDGTAATTTDPDAPPAWAADLTDRLDRIEQGEQARTQAQADQEALDRVNEEYSAVQAEHALSDEDMHRIRLMAAGLAAAGQSDAIASAVSEFQSIRNGTERALIDDKLGQPTAAQPGGAPNTAPQKVTSFRDAKALVQTRFERASI